MKKAKIKIKGYIKNITNSSFKKINCFGIKKDNQILFNIEDSFNKIEISLEKLKLTRKNKNIENIMEFINQKNTKSIINLVNIYLNIYTNNLIIKGNYIHIFYKIIDTNEKYELKLEMSEIK